MIEMSIMVEEPKVEKRKQKRKTQGSLKNQTENQCITKVNQMKNGKLGIS